MKTRYGMKPAQAMTSAKTPAPSASFTEASITSSAPASVAMEPKRKVAIFVAHGMGQQIPFQTLDQVAEGLRKENEKHGNPNPAFDVRAIKFEDEWLSRIEMEVKSRTQDPIDVHLYEGYWAPLTEGKINAGGVTNFLNGASRNGIKNGSRLFRRWLFDRYYEYESPARVLLYLLIALAGVLALVEMNSTIALVAAGRAMLAKTPSWLSDGLFADLTTTFNFVVTMMAIFGASLGIAQLLRKPAVPQGLRRAWGALTIPLFAAALFTVILGGLAIALLFYGHVKLDTSGSEQLWHRVAPAGLVDGFNDCFDTVALWLAIGVAGLFLLNWIVKIIMGIIRDLMHSSKRTLTLAIAFGMLIFIGLVVWISWSFWNIFQTLETPDAVNVARSGLAWPLLIAATAMIRQVLVQYVGDVAIYVAPYKLDEFFQLRNQIRDCVQRVAHAVYAQQRDDGSGPAYDQVFVVGHSLGSVVVYDVLNRLVNDDSASGNALNVVDRTPLLLTFGSPLDKTAFLFAVQAQDTDEAREALAATLQPLIQDYAFRPPQWINIYSPWDIISGPLGFYDPPGSTNPKRVCNQRDPDATTLLTAHVEYWTNPMLFNILYDAVCQHPVQYQYDAG